MTPDTVALILSISGAACAGTWTIHAKLAQIQVLLATLAAKVENHDAQIIDLKKAKETRRKPQ